MARAFVSFTFGRVPVLWIFFLLKKDVGFFREIHLWLFESDKQVNCILVNNFLSENLALNFKEPGTYFSTFPELQFENDDISVERTV